MQHEFGVCVDELDQSQQEALVASSVKFCGFLFEFKAVGHLPFEGQTLPSNTEGQNQDPAARSPHQTLRVLLLMWCAAARACRRPGSPG